MDGRLDDVAGHIASGLPSGVSIMLVTVAEVRPGGTWNSTVESLPGPLVDAEDEALRVFGFLHGGQDDILWRDRGEGVLGGQRAGVRRGDDGGERVVVFVAVADGERVFPRAGVRIERVVEVVVAAGRHRDRARWASAAA